MRDFGFGGEGGLRRLGGDWGCALFGRRLFMCVDCYAVAWGLQGDFSWHAESRSTYDYGPYDMILCMFCPLKLSTALTQVLNQPPGLLEEQLASLRIYAETFAFPHSLPPNHPHILDLCVDP